MSLQQWECKAPACQALNVADRTHCSVCQAPRRGTSAAVRHIPAVDLQPFATDHFVAQRRRLHASLDMVGGELYLTLTPPSGDPAVYAIEENTLHPCDNFGRRGW